MPYAASAARAQPTDNDKPSRPRTPTRVLGLLIGLALLVPAAATSPAPATAHASCTGWTSKTVPPPSIRVLRTQSGRVEKVDFRRYVVVVMGLEWPYWYPRAALEAGAIAVKQYGWYFTLAGNHRRGFVNAAGKCYDVVDSTRDQLYRPGRAIIRDKQRNAVDRTWKFSLRKDGKFILTQYRRGKKVPCGADADGWRLKARSVKRCAKAGKPMEKIQAIYYGPQLAIMKTDGSLYAYDGQLVTASAGSTTQSDPGLSAGSTVASGPRYGPSRSWGWGATDLGWATTGS